MLWRHLLALGLIICLNVVASATQQGCDKLRFGVEQFAIQQVPLNALWLDGNGKFDFPKFDFDSTTNWKSYEASWEIRISKLYLTAFKAKRGGKPLSFSDVSPGNKLPCLATWFTGHFISPIGDNDQDTGHYAVIVTAHITEGEVTQFTLATDKPLEFSWNGVPEQERKDESTRTK